QKAAAVVRMQLAGANPSPQVEGTDPLPGTSNYLLGNDAASWRTGVPTYAKVKYGDVYPGVDLIYYGNPQQLEYDFVLAPGASTYQIEMQISGADRLRLEPSGDLIAMAGDRPVRWHKP